MDNQSSDKRNALEQQVAACDKQLLALYKKRLERDGERRSEDEARLRARVKLDQETKIARQREDEQIKVVRKQVDEENDRERRALMKRQFQLENTIECLDAEKAHFQQAGQRQPDGNFVELRQDEIKIEIDYQPPVNTVAATTDLALANGIQFAAPATSTTSDIAQNAADARLIRSTSVHDPVNNETTANSTSLGSIRLPSSVVNQFSDGLPRMPALTSEGQSFVQAVQRAGSRTPAADSSISARSCSLPTPGDTEGVSAVDRNFSGKQAFVPSPRTAVAIQQPKGRPTRVDIAKQNPPQSSQVMGKSLADRITFKDSRSASPNINDQELETRKRRLENGEEVQAKKPNLGSNHNLRSRVTEERALSRLSTAREPESSNVGPELLTARALEPATGPLITTRYDYMHRSTRKGYTFPVINFSQIERIFGADLRTGFYYQRIPFDDLPMIAIMSKNDQPHMPRGEVAGGTYYTALQPARDALEHFPVLITSSAGKYRYAGNYAITETKIVPFRQANDFSPEMKWNLVRSLYYTQANGRSIMREEHIKELVKTGVCRTELEATKIRNPDLFKRLLKIELTPSFRGKPPLPMDIFNNHLEFVCFDNEFYSRFIEGQVNR